MSNALYDKGRESFLKGEIAWATDNIKVMLVKSTYTVNLATDQFVAIISGADIVVRSANLASKTTAAGVADAADLTFTAVSGAAAAFIVIYQDSGSDATSRLIGYIDTASNLPVTPNGGDITIQFDSGSNKIFKL